MVLKINQKELVNSNLSDNDKGVIQKVIKIASNHDGASAGEVIAFKFLCSLASDCEVDMGEVLYYLNFSDITTLLKIQAQGTPIHNFWYEMEVS